MHAWTWLLIYHDGSNNVINVVQVCSFIKPWTFCWTQPCSSLWTTMFKLANWTMFKLANSTISKPVNRQKQAVRFYVCRLGRWRPIQSFHYPTRLPTKRNEFTRLVSFPIILHKTTTRFPTNAITPNTQTQYFSTWFFSSSSQLETPWPTSEVQKTFGRLFSAWQHNVKWSTFLRKRKCNY